jgi:hypothetical protein
MKSLANVPSRAVSPIMGVYVRPYSGRHYAGMQKM